MLGYQMTLGMSGVAKLGVRVGSNHAKRGTESAVDLAAMVVAKVGDGKCLDGCSKQYLTSNKVA
mgnify:CR=1 FL=1